MKQFKIKRIYEEASADDGRRILVDRLWPRGVTKEKARIDLWMKDIAPSPGLRKWYGHDPFKWTEFRERYIAELAGNSKAVDLLLQEAEKGPVTLVYAAKDSEHSHALALAEFLMMIRRP